MDPTHPLRLTVVIDYTPAGLGIDLAEAIANDLLNIERFGLHEFIEWLDRRAEHGKAAIREMKLSAVEPEPEGGTRRTT